MCVSAASIKRPLQPCEAPPLQLVRHAAILQLTLALVAEVQRTAEVTETSLLNFVVSDGRTLIASRCVFPEQDAAASLYYSEGAAFHRSSVGQDGGQGSEAADPSDAARRANGSSLPSKSSANPARDSSVTGVWIVGRDQLVP